MVERCLMSAPAAKKPSTAERMIMTLMFPASSAAWHAASRPSRITGPSALAGPRSIVTSMVPSSSRLPRDYLHVLLLHGHGFLVPFLIW